jgi:hypothetical protein
MVDGGYTVATRDVGQIVKWWTECPDANIGASPHPSGHFVLDIDDKGTKHGSDTLRHLTDEHGALPSTFTITTPTGGKHLWFTGDTKSSVERVGPGLDIRGRGGYVLLPGSSVDGRPYTAEKLGVIDEGPAWVVELNKRRARDAESAISDDLDTSANIARAIAYLEGCVEKGDVSIEGSGGNATAFRIGAMLSDLGVSRDKAVELLLRHWNDNCQPPWSEGELTDGVHSPIFNAYEYSENEAGSKGVRDNVSNFTGITRDGAAVGSKKPKRSRFRPYTRAEMFDLPEPIWVVPKWIQDQSSVLLFGPPSSAKSFVALDLCCSFATGKQALGFDYTHEGKCDVVYCAGEGYRGIAKKRLVSWEAHRRSGDIDNFYLVPDAPSAGEDPSEVNEFIKQMEEMEIKPGVIVFDTLSRMLTGLDENTAKDASTAMARLDEIKEHFKCVVIVVHHTSKDGKDARGSGAFRAGFDTMIACSKDGEDVDLYLDKQKEGADGLRWAMTAHEVVDSLALSPAVREKIEEPSKDDFSQRERSIIMEILTEGNYNNLGNGLETKVLADMYLRKAGEMPDDVMEEAAAVLRMTKALNGKAAKSLKSFVVSTYKSNPIIWGLKSDQE